MGRKSKIQLSAEACEQDLWEYAQTMLPLHSWGDIHRKMFQRMGDKDRDPNLLFLIARDHLKSTMAAVYSTWRVARNPAYTILYVTADEDLGKLQMGMMKQIFDSDEFRVRWPSHFIPEEGRRKKWQSWAINVDHPIRSQLNIRDETIAVKTVKAGKTGRHPDEIIYDDLVVPENAYTATGRREVSAGSSQAASLAKTDSCMTAFGTRYHPADQYSIWENAMVEDYNDKGEFLGKSKLWHVEEHAIEDAGDGTGNFIWPRVFNPKINRWFGFDPKTLARKKAEYFANNEFAQYYAQYYLDPNDPESNRIQYSDFEYLEPKFLRKEGGRWMYRDRLLQITAGMDLAATDVTAVTAKSADYTAIAVTGQDKEGFIYVLELNQFQTDKRAIFYEEIKRLRDYWGFREIHVEAESGFKIALEGVRESVREDGSTLIVKGTNAPRGMAKSERHASIAEPRFINRTVKIQKGTYFKELEDQVVMARPAHDDLLDALCICFDHTRKPVDRVARRSNGQSNVVVANARFGGR